MDAELKAACDAWVQQKTPGLLKITNGWILNRQLDGHEVNFWVAVRHQSREDLTQFNDVMRYLHIPIEHLAQYNLGLNSVLVRTPWGERRTNVFQKLERLLDPYATGLIV